MDINTQKAKAYLFQGNYTCVLCRDEEVFTSSHRGVKPLLDFLESGKDFSSFSAADKVVGKATAFLYCLLGIQFLYAHVLSVPAQQVLKEHGICVSYDLLVPGIRNRENTGPCPMEYATQDIQSPLEALLAIQKTLQNLQKAEH